MARCVEAMALQASATTTKRKAANSASEFADQRAEKVASPSREPNRVPPTPKKKTAKKSQKKPLTVKSAKYIHIHQYLDTLRWGAWYNCPMGTGEQLYIGTHLTENLAARARDRALLKYKPVASRPIELNFIEADYAPDEKLRDMLTNREFTDLLAAEAHPGHKRVEPTECLVKFMAEEAALGNLPTGSGSNARNYKVVPLDDYLKLVIEKRTPKVTASLTLEAEKYPTKAEQAEKLCLTIVTQQEANPNGPARRSSWKSPVSSSSIIPAMPTQLDALAIVPVQLADSVLALASVPKPIASSAPADCHDALPNWNRLGRSRLYHPKRNKCPLKPEAAKDEAEINDAAKSEAKINEVERVKHELQPRNQVHQERLKGKKASDGTVAMVDKPKNRKKKPIPKPVRRHGLEGMVKKINLNSEAPEPKSGHATGTCDMNYMDAPGLHLLADVALAHEDLNPYKL